MYNTKFVLTNGKEIYPGYLDKEKREELRKQYGDKREYLRCGCRNDQKLFYRFSEDLKLYPEHNNYVHDKNCCRYKSETGESERKTAYIVSDEDGEVTAYLTFNPKEFSKSEQSEKEEDNPPLEDQGLEAAENEATIEKDASTVKREEKKEPKLSLSGLIRSMNVDTFTERILNDRNISSRENFSKLVYHRMKKVKASRMKKPIGELSLETDGVRFIYAPFAGASKKEENGLKKYYLNNLGPNGEIYKNFIFPETMEKLVKEYKKAYGIEPDGDTMVAGFQYYTKTRSGTSYKVLGRVHLFQASSVGIYCRTLAEKAAFDSLHDIVNNDNRIKFWIPADDESIGGIIEMDGKVKKILLLLRSKKDEHITFDDAIYQPVVVGEGEPLTKGRLYDVFDQLT